MGSLDGLLALLHGEAALAGTHILDEETGGLQPADPAPAVPGRTGLCSDAGGTRGRAGFRAGLRAGHLERCDLVLYVADRDRPPLNWLLEMVSSTAFRRVVAKLGGHRPEHTGEERIVA